jgi:hypothetical protein
MTLDFEVIDLDRDPDAEHDSLSVLYQLVDALRWDKYAYLTLDLDGITEMDLRFSPGRVCLGVMTGWSTRRGENRYPWYLRAPLSLEVDCAWETTVRSCGAGEFIAVTDPGPRAFEGRAVGDLAAALLLPELGRHELRCRMGYADSVPRPLTRDAFVGRVAST